MAWLCLRSTLKVSRGKTLERLVLCLCVWGEGEGEQDTILIMICTWLLHCLLLLYCIANDVVLHAFSVVIVLSVLRLFLLVIHPLLSPF